MDSDAWGELIAGAIGAVGFGWLAARLKRRGDRYVEQTRDRLEPGRGEGAPRAQFPMTKPAWLPEGSEARWYEDPRVSVTDHQLQVEMGPALRAVIPLDAVAQVSAIPRPLFWWRGKTRGSFAANDTQPAVVLGLRRPVRVLQGRPRDVSAVAIQVQEPRAFVAMIAAQPGVSVARAELDPLLAKAERHLAEKRSFDNLIPRAAPWALAVVPAVAVVCAVLAPPLGMALIYLGFTLFAWAPFVAVVVAFADARVRRGETPAVPFFAKAFCGMALVYSFLWLAFESDPHALRTVFLTIAVGVPTAIGVCLGVRMLVPWAQLIAHTSRAARRSRA